MPVSAPRICSKCHNIVESNTKCPICTKASNIDYTRFQRDKTTYNEVYNTTRWRLVRDIRMKQDGGLCVMCKADGILNKANVVDHIIEIKDGGEPFDIKNTQSLCHLHHNKKSALERKKRDAL